MFQNSPSCFISAVWDRLVGMVSDAASNVLSGVVEAVRTLFEGDPETRRQVAFSVAMIALSAKMAKADGVVTETEVAAFRDIFKFPDDQAQNVARLYNLARQDVAGYEAYAEKLASLCVSCEQNCPVLEDIIDGLFHIAKADGLLHERESGFLARIAEVFGISEAHYRTIAARHVDLGEADPYLVLGVSRGTAFGDIRKAYRKLVADNHPDRLIGRGMPEEFVAIATRRLAAINAAFEMLEREFQPA